MQANCWWFRLPCGCSGTMQGTLPNGHSTKKCINLKTEIQGICTCNLVRKGALIRPRWKAGLMNAMLGRVAIFFPRWINGASQKGDNEDSHYYKNMWLNIKLRQWLSGVICLQHVYACIFSEWTVLKYWPVVATSFYPPSSMIVHNETSGNTSHIRHPTSIMTTGGENIADDGLS
jgi:hypothetical protein